MLEKTPDKSPVIVLKDIKCEDLEALLDYMYLGEVNVRQSDLASLIKAAENLRIKGLAVPDDEPPKKPVSHREKQPPHSPPAKRKRRDESDDGRDDVRPVQRRSPPPSSRPKSPISQHVSPALRQQINPSPLRQNQEQPMASNEDRTNRPLSSPVEAAPPNQSQAQNQNDDTPFVKVEMEDSEMPADQGYDLSADGFKEEESEEGGGTNNDLPEFLQAAAAGALTGAASFSHPSFAGPSGFNPVSNCFIAKASDIAVLHFFRHGEWRCYSILSYLLVRRAIFLDGKVMLP